MDLSFPLSSDSSCVGSGGSGSGSISGSISVGSGISVGGGDGGISGIGIGGGIGVSSGGGSCGSGIGRGVGGGSSKGGSINNSIEGRGSVVVVVIADPTPDIDSDSDDEFFDALSHSHCVKCQIEWLDCEFDHFDLDSESGQSSDESELEDNSFDQFVEQNNVDKIIQSLINNEIPIHHQTQVQKLHPVEEDLMILIKKHNLPIHLYKDFLALAEQATSSEYDFASSPIYQTTLDHMKKKYILEAGSPLSEALLQLMIPFFLCMFIDSSFYIMWSINCRTLIT